MALFSSCEGKSLRNGQDTEPDTLHVDFKGKTVVVYMAAQNSLGVKGNQRADSLEIMSAYTSIPTDAQLLLFIDDQYTPRMYKINNNTSRPILVKRWKSDENSASPIFFQNVLKFIKRYYPSEEYGLVMWSHATGWLPQSSGNEQRMVRRLESFGIDDGNDMGLDYGSEMDISDMADAMSSADFHARYIFFDACLMQNIEVAYALRKVADYIVASPISTPGAGANYAHQLSDGFFNDDVSVIASTYLSDVCDAKQSENYGDFGLVISVVKTSGLEQLAGIMRELMVKSSLMGHQSPNMEDVLNYQAYSRRFYYRPHNYDMAEAIRRIWGKNATTIVDALDKIIIYKGATQNFWIGPGDWTFQNVDMDSYCGVSMYVPQDLYTRNKDASLYGDLNVRFGDTSWYSDAGWALTGW